MVIAEEIRAFLKQQGGDILFENTHCIVVLRRDGVLTVDLHEDGYSPCDTSQPSAHGGLDHCVAVAKVYLRDRCKVDGRPHLLPYVDEIVI